MAKSDLEGSGLFQQVMKDVKPLRRGNERKYTEPVTKRKDTNQTKLDCQTIGQTKPELAELQHGDIGGLDRRTGKRFKRGQLPVEAHLDLHGMTQSEAYSQLKCFLSEQQQTGRRCVMVVTGKGTGKAGGGVLRTIVPNWLNEIANRKNILAFEYARQKDGGAGALYVLLKRNKNRTSS